VRFKYTVLGNPADSPQLDMKLFLGTSPNAMGSVWGTSSNDGPKAGKVFHIIKVTTTASCGEMLISVMNDSK
jgi:hypothetical protein